MLIPARTDTKYFHQYIQDKAQVRFLKGRLKFGKMGDPKETEQLSFLPGEISEKQVEYGDAAPFPSMIVVFLPPNTP